MVSVLAFISLLQSWHQLTMTAAHSSLLTTLCAKTCRLRSAEDAGTSVSEPAQGNHQTKAVPYQSRPHTLGTPPRYPSPSPLPVAPQAAAPPCAPQAPLQGSTQQPSSQGGDQQPYRSFSTEQSLLPRAVSTIPGGTQPKAASKAGLTAGTVQLVLDVSDSSCSVHAMLSPVAEAAAEDVMLSDVKAAAGAAAESCRDESAAASSHQAHSPQSAESGSHTPTGQHLSGSGFEHPGLAELQGLLLEEKKKTAALIGKTPLFRRIMSSGCCSCSSPSPNCSPFCPVLRLPE